MGGSERGGRAQPERGGDGRSAEDQSNVRGDDGERTARAREGRATGRPPWPLGPTCCAAGPSAGRSRRRARSEGSPRCASSSRSSCSSPRRRFVAPRRRSARRLADGAAPRGARRVPSRAVPRTPRVAGRSGRADRRAARGRRRGPVGRFVRTAGVDVPVEVVGTQVPPRPAFARDVLARATKLGCNDAGCPRCRARSGRLQAVVVRHASERRPCCADAGGSAAGGSIGARAGREPVPAEADAPGGARGREALPARRRDLAPVHRLGRERLRVRATSRSSSGSSCRASRPTSDWTGQLVARATWSDGSQRDVTDLAAFSSNDEGLAVVDEDGALRDRPPRRRRVDGALRRPGRDGERPASVRGAVRGRRWPRSEPGRRARRREARAARAAARVRPATTRRSCAARCWT